MDLAYGPEYEEFRATLRAFLEANRERAPRGGIGVAGGSEDPGLLAWQKLLIEHGYAARTIPKQYGGHGAEPDILKRVIMDEEFARAGVSRGIGGQGPDPDRARAGGDAHTGQGGVEGQVDRHLGERQRMAERDQFGSSFCRHNPCHPRHADYIPFLQCSCLHQGKRFWFHQDFSDERVLRIWQIWKRLCAKNGLSQLELWDVYYQGRKL